MAKIRKTQPKKKTTPRKPAKKVEQPEEDFDWGEEEAENKPKVEMKYDPETGLPAYDFRFVASLQDKDNPNLYRDFAESNTLADIKKKSEKEVEKQAKKGLDLGVLVTDREGWFLSYRYNLTESPKVEKDHRGNSKIVNDIETRVKSWVKDGS